MNLGALSIPDAPAPTRPLLRYHGGKWLLAPWIIEHFPPHRVYVEPFGGAASVLFRKPISYAEIYNDLDDEVVGLFRVLQDPAGSARLHELLKLTPFARSEFELAYQSTEDPIEQARRLIIRSFMGFGSDGCNDARPTGFRSNSNRSGTTPAHDWVNYADNLDSTIARLRSVIIENRDAKLVMERHDGPETLHFCDPPYLLETRGAGMGKNYRHELSDQEHDELLEFLCALSGMVVLCGYPSAKYDDALRDWYRVERIALADGARKRIEVLWINPAAQAANLRPKQKHLFGEAA